MASVRLFPLTRLFLAGGALASAFILRDVVVNGLLAGGTATLRSATTIGVVGLAYVLYVRLIERRRVTEFDARAAPGETMIGALAGVALIGTVAGALVALGYLRLESSTGAPILLLTLAVVETAFVEEVIVRAVLFRIAEETFGTWTALALVALLFGLLHLGNPNVTPWGVLAIAATAGVLLAAAFVLTRRLWLAMGVHFGVNWSQGPLLGVPVSGTERAGLFNGRLDGPALLTGGEFGLEASLLLVVVGGVVALAVVRQAYRRGHFVPPMWADRHRLRSGGMFLGHTARRPRDSR